MEDAGVKTGQWTNRAGMADLKFGYYLGAKEIILLKDVENGEMGVMGC